jgi:hypothetical protein
MDISATINLANDLFENNLQVDSATNLINKLCKEEPFNQLSNEFKYKIYILKARLLQSRTWFLEKKDRSQITNYYFQASEYASEASSEKYLSKAHGYFYAKDPRAAHQELNQILSQDPTNLDAIYLKVAYSETEENLESFLDTLDLTISRKPLFKANLAIFYYNQKNFNKGKILLREALDSFELKRIEEISYLNIFFNRYQLEALDLMKQSKLTENKIKELEQLIPEIDSYWSKIKGLEISKYYTSFLLSKLGYLSFQYKYEEILKVCNEGLSRCKENSYEFSEFNFQKTIANCELENYNEAHQSLLKVNFIQLPYAKPSLAEVKFRIGHLKEKKENCE